MHVEPFTISVSEEAMTDLKERLARTRWPDQIEGIGWDQGTDRVYLENIVQYWRSGFDWRAQEANLNKLPQFRSTIDQYQIHFVHARAKSGHGLPLIITHGWPGTFAEIFRTTCAAFQDAADASILSPETATEAPASTSELRGINL